VPWLARQRSTQSRRVEIGTHFATSDRGVHNSDAVTQSKLDTTNLDGKLDAWYGAQFIAICIED
jgi:hypothetical protein